MKRALTSAADLVSEFRTYANESIGRAPTFVSVKSIVTFLCDRDATKAPFIEEYW